ncbi:MAG: hypothetical protein Q7R92_01605 [bacterium]|nr:hypothetical protein [bacterium]
MIQIIVIIIGTVALFKKSIAITKKSELRRPKTYTFGIVTISVAIAVSIIDALLTKIGAQFFFNILVFTLQLIIPIIAAIKLKEPKST